jgi:hypothetical protein
MAVAFPLRASRFGNAANLRFKAKQALSSADLNHALGGFVHRQIGGEHTVDAGPDGRL